LTEGPSLIPPTIWPQTWYPANYLSAVTVIPFFLYLRNTVFVCLGVGTFLFVRSERNR